MESPPGLGRKTLTIIMTNPFCFPPDTPPAKQSVLTEVKRDPLSTTLPIKEALDLQGRALDLSVEEKAVAFYESVRLEAADSLRGPFLSSVRGGKRFRALCAAVGAAVALSRRCSQCDGSELLGRAIADSRVRDLMAALEFYQASALTHDDLLDDAATRRGAPAAHVVFAREHKERKLWGSSAEYGRDGAVLLGDLLLSAAEACMSDAFVHCGPKQSRNLLRAFASMTGEVAVGQWADTSGSYLPLDASADHDARIEQTLEVVSQKSGRYSIVHPAVLGCICVGGGRRLQRILEDILEPAGLAFQLRDDALGAFGEPEETGKPTGSDIRERKRTVLLFLTLSHAPTDAVTRLEHLYAQEQLTDDEVEEIRGLLADHGATAHEELIAGLASKAICALEAADLAAGAKALLEELIERVTSRRF